MRKCCALVVLAVLTTMLVAPMAVVQAAPDSARWVLVDVQDITNSEAWTQANTNPVYLWEPTYGRGSYVVKRIYTGKTDNYYSPPYVNGESLTLQANWSKPPQIIAAGEAVVLTVKLGAPSNNQSAFWFSGSTRAWLNGSNMTTAAGRYHFECSHGTKYASVNETVSAKAPSGSREGARLELEVQFYYSMSMSTKYIYEWTASEKQPVDPMTYNWRPSLTKPFVGTTSKIGVDAAYAGDLYPPGPVYDQNGDLLDTGIKVSELYGECTYQQPDWDEDRWEFLEPDTVLPVNAKIRTSGDSGVILSMPDMTTFELKPESTLILTQRTGKRSVLKILAGNVITNIKKIMTDGTMEVEMSQAIAGARGTTFVCTEDENGSTLKVFEGTVDYTPNGKAPVVLKAGEAINSKQGVTGAVTKFSAAKELATWGKKTQDRISGILAAQGISLKDGDEVAAVATAPKVPMGSASAPVVSPEQKRSAQPQPQDLKPASSTGAFVIGAAILLALGGIVLTWTAKRRVR